MTAAALNLRRVAMRKVHRARAAKRAEAEVDRLYCNLRGDWENIDPAEVRYDGVQYWDPGEAREMGVPLKTWLTWRVEPPEATRARHKAWGL